MRRIDKWVSKWKSRRAPENLPRNRIMVLPDDEISSVAPFNANEAQHTEKKEGQRDLWHEAFEKLPFNLRNELEKRGINNNEPKCKQIDKFRQEAERARDRSMERDRKPKVGDLELLIRQIPVNIVGWTRKSTGTWT